MKISFIIPAFNAERYIATCLNSLKPFLALGHQLVLVDDGSTDSTTEIAKEVLKEEENAIILQQTNQGQSVARNRGLQQATGDYIWFIDADDYIDEEAGRVVVEAAESQEFDAIVFGLKLEEGGQSVPSPVLQRRTYPDGIDYFRKSNMQATFRTYPVNKLFRRSLILEHDIRFPEGRIYEDMQFNLAFFLHAGQVLELPANPYHYVLSNPASSTNKNLIQKRDLAALTSVEEATEMLDSGKYKLSPSDLAFQVLVYTFLSSCLLKKYIPLSFSDKEALEFVQQTMKHPLFKGAVRRCAQHPSIGLKRWAMALCLWLSPRLSRYLINWMI